MLPDHADRARTACSRGACCRAEDAGLLVRADRIWRGVQGILRLVLGRAVQGDPPEAAMPALARVAGSGAELTSVRATLDQLAQHVRDVFTRQIGDPDLQK